MHKNIGKTATDRVTGFSGIVVGRVEYLTGCEQVLIQPRVRESGDFTEARWFDEQRVEYQGEGRLEIDNGATPGCDMPAPIR